MKRVWTGATFAIALGCAASISAQTGSQPTSGSVSTSPVNRTVTVTGCLQRSGAPSSATSGTASGSSGQWTLANATMGSSAGTMGIPGVGATGSGTISRSGSASTTLGSATPAPESASPTVPSTSSASGGSGTSSSSYILDPGTQDLSGHTGHRIEVTGNLAPSNSMSGAGRSAPSTSGSTGETATGSTVDSSASGDRSGGTPGSGSTATAPPVTSPSGAVSPSAMASSMGGGQRIQVVSARMITANCQ